LRGGRHKEFYRYDPAAKAWTRLADTPAKAKEGGSIAYATDNGTGYLYALRGEDKKHFWRYGIVGDTWASMADAHQNVKHGGALASDGGNQLYALRGDDKTDF
jgi:hypothetical protein